MTIVTGQPATAADVVGMGLVIGETEVFNAAGPAAWTDLDLSGTIGAKSSLVMLKIFCAVANVRSAAVRRNGDADDLYELSSGVCHGEMNNGFVVLITPTDAAGVIEWIVSNADTFVVDVIAYIAIPSV